MPLVIPGSAGALSDAVWIDLLNPTDEERRQVEQAIKLRLPTEGEIEEIESSSRVFKEGATFYLSTPVLESMDSANAAVTSVGFVLSPSQLVTLRFAHVAAFDDVAVTFAGKAPPSAHEAFVKILESIVEQTADALEHATAELEKISHAAFRADRPIRRKKAKTGAALRAALQKIGQMGDGISHIRNTLLGLARIATFAHESSNQGAPAADQAAPAAAQAAAAAAQARMAAIRGDIASLNDYQANLSGKVQFLLDATLGFISIEQNEIFKALTVASVVGVPPVLIAGIYGMNFKYMPELQWSLGYPFAVALIVASALVPIAWFKWRRWI
jgi:magnesium transporter